MSIKQSRINTKNLSPLILLIFLTSCVVYTPQVSPPILIEDKGELQTDIGVSFSSILITPGINAGVTYCLTDYLVFQSFASYITSGTYHIEESFGLNKKLNDKNKISLLTGCFYGHGDVFDQLSSIGKIKWDGYYQSPFVKLQFVNKCKKIEWGIGLKVGDFKPKYNRTYYLHNRNIFEPESETFVDQRGLLIEASLFIIVKFTDRLGITINAVDTWIKPLNQFDKYLPYKYGIEYNYYGNIGVGVYYKIITGYNRVDG